MITKQFGNYYFSFDGKTIYNYFSEDRDKLTKDS